MLNPVVPLSQSLKGSNMDWSFNEENQKKYDEVLANNRRMQEILGIEPRTLEQRAADYQRKKAEQDELKKLMGKRRPPPKWKL